MHFLKKINNFDVKVFKNEQKTLNEAKNSLMLNLILKLKKKLQYENFLDILSHFLTSKNKLQSSTKKKNLADDAESR